MPRYLVITNICELSKEAWQELRNRYIAEVEDATGEILIKRGWCEEVIESIPEKKKKSKPKKVKEDNSNG